MMTWTHLLCGHAVSYDVNRCKVLLLHIQVMKRGSVYLSTACMKQVEKYKVRDEYTLCIMNVRILISERRCYGQL